MFAFRVVAAALFVLCIPVIIFTTGVRILTQNPDLYSYSIETYKVPAKTMLPQDELLRGATQLRLYLTGQANSPNIRVAAQDSQPVPLFNSKELAHLADVRSLIQWSYRIQVAALLFALAYVVAVYVWAREGSVRSLMKLSLLGSLVTIGVVVGVGAFAVTGFDSAFRSFHLLLFDNDFWKMNPRTDRLIQMFPEAFWVDTTVFFALISLGTALAVAVACSVQLGLTHAHSPKLKSKASESAA